MNKLKIAVPCLFGVESYLKDEIFNLGYDVAQVDDGRIYFEGDETAIARANLSLRCGERVLLVLGEFTARSFEELFVGVKNIPWEKYIGRKNAFIVTGSSIKSMLTSIPNCQKIVKKSIVDRLMEKHKTSLLPETESAVQIQFFIKNDEACIMIDTSGEPLHKRGYRAEGNLAPIRETLAAAMIYQSRYSGKSLFADPLCGSGTIAIEAAMIAENIAPGIKRRFLFETYDFVDKKHLREAKEEAFDMVTPKDFTILARDTDPEMGRIVLQNARLAGVDKHILFSNERCGDLVRSEERGIIITNPPYGERMNERIECESIYKEMGESFLKLKNWKYYIITSHEEFEKFFGKRADKKRKMYNGMIKCDLYQYFK